MLEFGLWTGFFEDPGGGRDTLKGGRRYPLRPDPQGPGGTPLPTEGGGLATLKRKPGCGPALTERSKGNRGVGAGVRRAAAGGQCAAWTGIRRARPGAGEGGGAVPGSAPNVIGACESYLKL